MKYRPQCITFPDRVRARRAARVLLSAFLLVFFPPGSLDSSAVAAGFGATTTCLQSYLVKFLEDPRSQHEFGPRRGQKAVLQIGARQREVQFLGRTLPKKASSGGGDLVFLDSKTGEVLILPASDTELTFNRSPVRLNDTSLIVRPLKQAGPTCATYSLQACLLQLEYLGAHVPALETGNRDSLFRRILRLVSEHTQGFNSTVQHANRLKFLNRNAIPHEVITAEQGDFRSRLIQHLDRGGIAIIDYQSSDTEIASLKVTSANGKQALTSVEHQVFYSKPDGLPGDGAHSVLALGTFVDAHGVKRILISDSAPGHLLFWDSKVLDTWEGSGNKAVLLHPKPPLPFLARSRSAPSYFEFKSGVPDPDRRSQISDLVGCRAWVRYHDSEGVHEVQGRILSHDSDIVLYDAGKNTFSWVWTDSIDSLKAISADTPPWERVDHLSQVDNSMIRKGQEQYGIARVLSDTGTQFLYGRITKQHLTGDFWVYRIRDSNGRAHIISQDEMIDLHVSEGSEKLARAFPFTPPKRVVRLNVSALLPRIVRGSSNVADLPIPEWVAIDSWKWNLGGLRKVLLAMIGREVPVTIVHSAGKLSHAVITGLGWDGRTPPSRRTLSLKDAKTGAIRQVLISEIAEIRPKIADPNASEKLLRIMERAGHLRNNQEPP